MLYVPIKKQFSSLRPRVLDCMCTERETAINTGLKLYTHALLTFIKANFTHVVYFLTQYECLKNDRLD